MALLQINFSCRSIMNRCSKLSHYVYKIPNAFYLANLAEPKKLASVVKPKARRALGIAIVGFVGDHLKDKKVTEFDTLD